MAGPGLWASTASIGDNDPRYSAWRGFIACPMGGCGCHYQVVVIRVAMRRRWRERGREKGDAYLGVLISTVRERRSIVRDNVMEGNVREIT